MTDFATIEQAVEHDVMCKIDSSDLTDREHRILREAVRATMDRVQGKPDLFLGWPD